jgi:hypothetical protein
MNLRAHQPATRHAELVSASYLLSTWLEIKTLKRVQGDGVSS